MERVLPLRRKAAFVSSRGGDGDWVSGFSRFRLKRVVARS